LPELKFPLPAPRELWLAESAAEWKRIYLETIPLESPVSPRFMDIVHDISLLDIMQEHIDVDLCCTAMIYSFWGQVWSFQESAKFYLIGESEGPSTKGLWLTIQQSELCRDIETLVNQLTKAQRQPLELQVIQHLFMMALYVSFEELQKFAGKGGEEEASRAHAFLQLWVDTPNARKAIWHAGQLFNAARNLPPAELRGFFSIAVYLGSLTLWVYAHLCSPISDTGQDSAVQQDRRTDDQNSNVALDGHETRETRIFISVGRGQPGLTSSPTALDTEERFIALHDPNVAFKITSEIYRNNFPVLEEPLPPLVENLQTLMRDLSSRPESRFSRAVTEEVSG
jgi:hypothetical protein